MRELHASIKKAFKGQLPDFPVKKYFGNTDQSFIALRQKGLQNYFQHAI